MPRKKKFQTSLPSIPCTEEMRKAVVAVADRNNLNLVDVIRQSITLFLSENDTKVSPVNRIVSPRSKLHEH